jgi:hypothetical protein
VRQSLDRVDIGTPEHGFGDAASKPGPGESAEFSSPIGGGAPVRSEPTPASKSASGREVGVRGSGVQAGYGILHDFRRNPLCGQPSADRRQRVTATMERRDPTGGIGGIVEKPRLAITGDKLID